MASPETSRRSSLQQSTRKNSISVSHFIVLTTKHYSHSIKLKSTPQSAMDPIDMLWSAIIAIQRPETLASLAESPDETIVNAKNNTAFKMEIETYSSAISSQSTCQVACLLKSMKTYNVGVLVQVYQAGQKQGETRNLCSEGIQNDEGGYDYVINLASLNGFFEGILKELTLLDDVEAHQKLIKDIYVRVVSAFLSLPSPFTTHFYCLEY